MRDPYEILGVRETADPQDIKSAYRALAKTWHPDRNNSDKGAQEKFSEISRAYAILSDPAERRKLDAIKELARKKERTGGIFDFLGAIIGARKRREGNTGDNPTGKASVDPGQAGNKATQTSRSTARTPPPDPDPDSDMMARIFGDAAQQKAKPSRRTVDEPPRMNDIPLEDSDKPHGKRRLTPWDALNALFPKAAAPSTDAKAGADTDNGTVSDANRKNAAATAQDAAKDKNTPMPQPVDALTVSVGLKTVLEGGQLSVRLPSGETIEVPVAPGLKDGSLMRYTPAGNTPSQPVDMILRHDETEPFRCRGNDLHADMHVSLTTAVLGARQDFETPDGRISVTIPPWSGSDRILRIAGRGLPDSAGRRGDLFLHLRLTLPESEDQRLIDLMRVIHDGLYI